MKQRIARKTHVLGRKLITDVEIFDKNDVEQRMIVVIVKDARRIVEGDADFEPENEGGTFPGQWEN